MNYTLKRDGWHFRLQKWTFGKDMPRFDNFCPFFWLVVFCIMASPFVGMLKLSLKAIGLLFTPIEYMSRPIEYMSRPIEWLVERVLAGRKVKYERSIVTFVDEMTDWQAYQTFKIMYSWYSYYKRDLDCLYTTTRYSEMRYSKKTFYYDRLDAWQKKHNDWKERILACRKEDEKIIAAELERKAASRAVFVKIAERTKLLVWLPIGVAANYLLYWSALLVLVCLENTGVVWETLFAVGCTVVGVAIIIALGFLIARMGWLEADIAKPFKAVGRAVFCPIGRGIKEVCNFLWMNVVAFKNNYCPKIEWKE